MRPVRGRVTLVSSQPNWGGGEQWLWSLGNGLASRDWEVSWIAPRDSALATRVEQANFAIHHTNGRGNHMHDVWHVRKFLKQQRPQLLQLNDSHAVFWASLAALGKSRVARVATKHTVFRNRAAIKYRWLVDRIICVSNAARLACIESGLRASQTSVVYGAIEQPTFNPGDRGSILQELGWANDTKLIVAVGNLQACKGHRFLIESIPLVRATYPTARLVIAGEGNERGALESLIEKHSLQEHVKLLGFRTDAPRWVSGADVVAQPSLQEALSLVAIQAQMLSKPLVATGIGGLAEVIAADAPTPLASIVEPENVESLARGLVRALQGGPTIESECRNAKARADQLFHIDRMVDQICGIYRELLQQHASVLVA